MCVMILSTPVALVSYKRFTCSSLPKFSRNSTYAIAIFENLVNSTQDTLMVFDVIRNKQKVYDVMFSGTYKYVGSKSVFNTLYIEIKHKC